MSNGTVIVKVISQDTTPDTRLTPSKLSVEERIRDALDLIESGFDSHQEWILVNKVYRDLMGIPEDKRSERVCSLIDMMDEVLKKYGIHGVAADRTGY